MLQSAKPFFMMRSAALTICVALVILLAAVTRVTARPLFGDVRHLYFGEVFLARLPDGLHDVPLVAVPFVDVYTGQDIIDIEATREAPIVALHIQDAFLTKIAVKASLSEVPRLLPFKILVSDAEEEELAESGIVILNEFSQHSIAEEQNEVTFDLSRHPIPLRTLDSQRQFFIRLDTYYRRTTVFEVFVQIPADHSETASTTVIPWNASFGVRFGCSISSDGFRISVKRKPTIPPLRLTLYQLNSVVSVPVGSRTRSKISDVSPHFVKILYGPGPINKMHSDDVGMNFVTVESWVSSSTGPAGLEVVTGGNLWGIDSVFRIVVEFDELHRKYSEHYVLEGATSILKRLRRMGGEEHVLMPQSWHALRSCFSDDFDKAKVQDHFFLRVALRNMNSPANFKGSLPVDDSENSTTELSLVLHQPFPIRNLQLHVVDGHNDTIFLEEEYDVPYVNFHHGVDPLTQTPFGWRNAVEAKFIAGGDVLQVFAFFDLRHDVETVSGNEGDGIINPDQFVCPTAEIPDLFTPNIYKHALMLADQMQLLPTRAIFEKHHHVDSLLGWIERHGGYVSDSILIDRSPPAHSRFSNLISSSLAHTAASWRRLSLASTSVLSEAACNSPRCSVLLSIPRLLFLTAYDAETTLLVRRSLPHGVESVFVEVAASWAKPSVQNTSAVHLPRESYWSNRWSQMAVMALFLSIQAEDPLRGVSYHSWVRAAFDDGPSVQTESRERIFTLTHSADWVSVFQAHGFENFGSVVSMQRQILDDVLDAIDDAAPWLRISVDGFVKKFAILQSFSFDAPRSDGGPLLFVAPVVHLCEHSDVPVASIRFDSISDSLTLSLHPDSARASSHRCQLDVGVQAHPLHAEDDSCARLVTCDLSQTIDDTTGEIRRMTTLESLLRRGVVYNNAVGVVDVVVNPPINIGVKRRIFTLQQAESAHDIRKSRFRFEEFVQRVMCLGSLDKVRCGYETMLVVLETRRQELPRVPKRTRDIFNLLTVGAQPSASEICIELARMLLKAHQVLEAQIDDIRILLQSH